MGMRIRKLGETEERQEHKRAGTSTLRCSIHTQTHQHGCGYAHNAMRTCFIAYNRSLCLHRVCSKILRKENCMLKQDNYIPALLHSRSWLVSRYGFIFYRKTDNCVSLWWSCSKGDVYFTFIECSFPTQQHFQTEEFVPSMFSVTSCLFFGLIRFKWD